MRAGDFLVDEASASVLGERGDCAGAGDALTESDRGRLWKVPQTGWCWGLQRDPGEGDDYAGTLEFPPRHLHLVHRPTRQVLRLCPSSARLTWRNHVRQPDCLRIASASCLSHYQSGGSSSAECL